MMNKHEIDEVMKTMRDDGDYHKPLRQRLWNRLVPDLLPPTVANANLVDLFVGLVWDELEELIPHVIGRLELTGVIPKTLTPRPVPDSTPAGDPVEPPVTIDSNGIGEPSMIAPFPLDNANYFVNSVTERIVKLIKFGFIFTNVDTASVRKFIDDITPAIAKEVSDAVERAQAPDVPVDQRELRLAKAQVESMKDTINRLESYWAIQEADNIAMTNTLTFIRSQLVNLLSGAEILADGDAKVMILLIERTIEIDDEDDNN